MVRPSVPIFIVESVEDAVKYYTEKLAFDIVELFVDQESKKIINFVKLRKGKCFIGFRTPVLEELAEFSIVKRCGNRGVAVYIPLKKGLDKYYKRCEKKRVNLVNEIKMQPWGDRTFQVKDPFGIRIVFAEEVVGFDSPLKREFVGMPLERVGDQTLDEMIGYLRKFGILRRAGKKYSKLWIKQRFGIKVKDRGGK